MSPGLMNNAQRGSLKRLLPGYNGAGYEGKGDSDMHTHNPKPGAYLWNKTMGFTVPTFDDLLRGLNCIPTGPDA